MTALFSIIAALMFFMFSCGVQKLEEQQHTTKTEHQTLSGMEDQEWRKPKLK